MADEVRVEIGGIGLLFRYKNCRIKENEKSELYIKDFIQPGRNDLIIDIEVGRLPKYSKDRMLFQAKENWRLYEGDGKHIFEIYQSHENEGNEKINQICVMEKGLSRANVYISPDADTGDEGVDIKNGRTWSLEQLVRVLGQLITISILHCYQGLLIHSSGIILNEEGIIFPGISGAGKTTLAKLWQKRKGLTVLSDDRVIVRRPSCAKAMMEARQKEGYLVYGSPWPGQGRVVSCRKAQLKKIIFLSKAEQNKLTPLEKKRSLYQLITQCFPAIWDKESIDFFLKFCAALVEDIPCYCFGFVPDESAVEFIENKIIG